MKLGAAWYGFREQTPANYFETAARLGLDVVEIPLYDRFPGHEHWTYGTQSGIRELRTAAERAGVEIVSGVADFSICPGDADWEGDQEAVVRLGRAGARRAIEIADAVGLDVSRIIEPDVDPELPAEDTREFVTACGEALADLADIATDHGITLVVENYCMTPGQMQRLLSTADHPAVETLYDPCNYHRLGEDPFAALEVLEGAVGYCHLKDAFRDDPRDPDVLFEGSRWSPSEAVGDGEIDWEPILATLDRQFDGYAMVEYELAEDVVAGTRRSLEHLTDIARRREFSFA